MKINLSIKEEEISVGDSGWAKLFVSRKLMRQSSFVIIEFIASLEAHVNFHGFKGSVLFEEVVVVNLMW